MSGAQTIRDVIIRIGLQSNSSGFSAPDLRKVEKEANDAAAAVGKLNKELRGGAGSGGGFGGSPRAPGGTSSQRAPDLFAGIDIGVNKYKDAVTRQKQFVDQIVAADEKMLSRGESMQRYYQQAAKSTDEFSKSQKAAMEISNQRAEATMLLANAGMKLARGVAFVTAANEQEYQSMLKLIATAQGYFDIFSGTIDAYKSYLNFSKAATAAKITEAAATTALATAENGLSAARTLGMAGGRAGALGRFASIGRAGPIGAAVAAAGASAYYSIRELGGVDRMNQRDRAIRSRTDAYNSPEAAAERDALGQSRIGRFNDMIDTRLASGRSLRAALANQRGGLSMTDAIGGIERDRRVSTEILGNAQMQGSPQQARIELLERERKIQEINLQAEQEKQSVYERQQEALQRQLDTSLSLKQAAVETLRAEENRYRSLEASLGRMSAGEANRLKTIGEKVQAGGKLSRSEAEFLDRSGIGGAQAESYFVQEGRKRGAGGILAAFGENQGLQAAQTNLQDFSTGEAARAATEARDMLDKVEKSLAKSFESETQILGRILNATEAVSAEQAKLEQRIVKIENGQLGNPFR